MNKISFSKKEKILFVLYKLYLENNNINIRYEDILIKTFETFPKDFHLRYYERYPDTETISRNLYQLKPLGYVNINNRKCTLTKSGIEKGKLIYEKLEGREKENELGRINSFYGKEIKRILNLPGFKLFVACNYDKIIDQDLFDLLQISARTKSTVIQGRCNHIKQVLDYCPNVSNNCEYIKKYLEFLKNKFKYLLTKQGD